MCLVLSISAQKSSCFYHVTMRKWKPSRADQQAQGRLPARSRACTPSTPPDGGFPGRGSWRVALNSFSPDCVSEKLREEEDRARQVFRVWAETPWGRCVQLRGPHAAHPTGAKKGQVGDHDGKGHAGAFPWVYYIQHFDPITSPRFSCPETIKLKANKTSKTLGLPVVCFQVFFQCLLRKALSWELHPHTRPHGI